VDDYYPMSSPDPDAVLVELRGRVERVAQVRAWLVARAGFSDSLQQDEPDGSLRVRMTVVPPEG
jgi:hypothetical protein